MGASHSNSSSSNHENREKFDVFISYGSKEVCGITSHLYNALCQKKVRTFVDYELADRNEVSPVHLKVIEESIISIVIFSEAYASCRLNLYELVEIMKRKRMNKQVVIPVFYNVDPSDLRNLKGSFKSCFNKLEMEALVEASNLSGWHSSVVRPESRLVNEIVKDVCKKLNDMSPWCDYKGLIGMHSRIELVLSLLRIELPEFLAIGIWGMGGIGKTTIAEVVFGKIANQFEGCYFVANVREESQRTGGLIHLRNQVLSKLLDEKIVLSTPNVPILIKRRLQRKRVLIVLDDVSNINQLETLAGGIAEFGCGTRVIITSRDKQLLRKFCVENVYKVQEFDYHEALQLLCKFAFKQDHPFAGFMEYSDRIINYAKGNPLAIKVVGSSLYGKSKQDWKSALNKLNKISNLEIHHLLRISYDGLDQEEKDIFLDIACFFNRRYEDYVMEILNDFYYSAEYGLGVLIDKSLVTIPPNKNIEMHDLLQDMGREIVHQESPRKPYKRTRLHHHEDICRVLGRNMGTEAIRGIVLDMTKMKKIDMSSQAFKNMFNVRFLKLYDGTPYHENQKTVSNVCLPSGLSYFPDALMYLRWDGYPSKALPSNFNLENIVQLNLSDSKVEQLWDGKRELPKLKWLILGQSRHLKSIPDISNSPSLKVIDLYDCKSLLDISSSIQHLTNLHYLRLRGCESLMSLSSNINFESLFTLDLSSCTNLKKFPPLSGEISILNLDRTAIEEIPSSIENLKRLGNLSLSYCEQLKHISGNIYKVKSLKVLHLNGCSKLQSLNQIPPGLQTLEAENCKQLQSLPDASCFAQSFVNSISDEGWSFNQLVYMFTNSLDVRLDNILAESLLVAFRRMAMTDKEYQVHADIGYPGNEIPEWFLHRSRQNMVNFQLPHQGRSNLKFLGLAFCVIIKSAKLIPADSGILSIDYKCHFRINCDTEIEQRGTLTMMSNKKSRTKIFCDLDHVLIAYRDRSEFKPLRDDYTTCSVELLPRHGTNLTHYAVFPVYSISDDHGLSLFVENNGANSEDTGRRMVEEQVEIMDEDDMIESGSSTSSRSADEEIYQKWYDEVELFGHNHLMFFTCVFSLVVVLVVLVLHLFIL